MLKLEGEDFLDFIEDRAGEVDLAPAADPNGMCILPGYILERNLQEHLDRAGYPTATLSHFTTIEDLARELLDKADEPSSMVSSGIRRQLIAAVFYELDPSPDIPEEVTIPELDVDTSTLVPSQQNALEALAERLPYHEDDVQETILDELDDYYRCTDAGEEHGRLVDIITDPSFDGQFERAHCLRSVRAFKAIDTLVHQQLNGTDESDEDDTDADRHFSRSHLVRHGRQTIPTSWSEAYDHVEWITVAGISVFDNPTLRFLEKLGEADDAPEVKVFSDLGSFGYNHDRMSEIDGASVDEEPPEVNWFDDSGAERLFRAIQGDAERLPDNVHPVEAPTDRRLVEHVASDVRERVQDGVDPSDFLIIAPNAGEYQTLVQDAFETVGLPVHVETRRATANIPAYRFLRDLVRLVEKAERDVPITYGELVDPIRLGYCNPSAQRSWPVDGRDFTTIEQRLHREQQQWNAGSDEEPAEGLRLEEWESVVEDIPSWTSDWNAVEILIEDVQNRIDDPPESADELIDDFGAYLGTYVWETFDHRRQLFQGPGIDNTRVAIAETHVTSLAEHVRREFDSVGRLYSQALNLFDQDPSWGLVGATLSAGLGGDTYAEQHLDANAIPVVDAGNAYFREAEHVYILGMNAGEFPSERDTPALLHSSLRKHVTELAAAGETPYFHLDSERSGYGESVDFYQASLAAAASGADITLLHTYRDQRGNEVSWSSFVDLFDMNEQATHTRVGEYLPEPRGPERSETAGDDDPARAETWNELSARISPRERLRSVLYHANRDYPENRPSVTADDVQALLEDIDHDVLQGEIQPRTERYHDPPVRLEIHPDEPAFEDVPLDAIAGGELHPHELDLFSQCGLKYYYYQFLFNFEGGRPDRETIPYYSSNRPHHRLYDLPEIVRDNYADPRNVERWNAIITELLPERQDPDEGLLQFEAEADLETWFADQDIDDFNDMLLDNLRRERELVFQEAAADIDRNWTWRERATFEVDGYQLSIPPHRVDRVQTDNGTYSIPIFYGRISNRATSALKACFNPPDSGENLFAEEDCETICEWCADDDCYYGSKYALDHRVFAGYEHEFETHDNSVLGIGIQEAWADAPGSRHLIIKTNHSDELLDDSTLEWMTARGYSNQWYDEKVPAWRTDFTEHAAELSADDPIVLEANEDLVNDECLRCVYKDLCFVPEGGD